MEQVIQTVQDLTHLSWTKRRNSSGTAGSFLKSQETMPEGKIFYKLSNYDSYNGITGHESVNEIIADRLLSILGIEHVSYQLIHADILVDARPIRTWLCASYDFRKRKERKISLDEYYAANRNNMESPLDFCIRFGWEDYIYRMLVVDYLILNRDRHGANIEILINPYKKSVRLAPLFDHGVSLFCRTVNEAALEKEDVMADKQVQCFIGSRSAWENLHLIPKDNFPHLNPLKESDKDTLLDRLEDALGRPWLEKIWEMIFRRWQSYETLRNQG